MRNDRKERGNFIFKEMPGNKFCHSGFIAFVLPEGKELYIIKSAFPDFGKADLLFLTHELQKYSLLCMQAVFCLGKY